MIKLVFNNGTEDTFLLVENVFEYTYNAIKTVLKITIREEDYTYEQFSSELKKCTGKLFAYDLREEEGETKEVLIGEYNGYDLGDYGFVANMINHKWNVDLSKEGSYEMRLKANEDATEGAYALIEELYNVIADLTAKVEALEAK